MLAHALGLGSQTCFVCLRVCFFNYTFNRDKILMHERKHLNLVMLSDVLVNSNA